MNPYQEIRELTLVVGTEAQQALQKSLIWLMQTQPLTQISVKDLCTQAHVARSTFYAYYTNIDDLLEEIENNLIYQLLLLNSSFIGQQMPQVEEDFLINTSQLIKQNHEIFKTFLVIQPNLRFIEKWKKAIKYHFWIRLYEYKNRQNERLILELVATQAITTFSHWLQYPEEVDHQQMNLLIRKTLQLLKESL